MGFLDFQHLSNGLWILINLVDVRGWQMWESCNAYDEIVINGISRDKICYKMMLKTGSTHKEVSKAPFMGLKVASYGDV